MGMQGTQNSQNKLEKVNIGGLTLSSLKTYYSNQDSNQWKRIESPEVNPHIHGQLIFNKGAKTIQWGERIVFSTVGVGTGCPHAK